MKVERVFTKSLKDIGDIFDSLEWKKFDVSLKDHRSNKILFELKDVEAPAHWSQQSIDIMVSKYQKIWSSCFNQEILQTPSKYTINYKRSKGLA